MTMNEATPTPATNSTEPSQEWQPHAHHEPDPDDPIKQRMDQLMDECIQKALSLIDAHGEFYPFGVTRDASGQLSATQARLVEDNPSVELVTQTLLRGLLSETNQGMYTTVAIVSDVRLRLPGTGMYTDAIRVMLEDRLATPMDFFMPYERQGKKLVLSELVAQQSKSILFPPVNAGDTQ